MRISKNTNIPFVVESVPALVAIFFFPARLPAIASVPMIGRKRANSMTSPSETFKNTVFALNPAKAEPLLPPQEEYAYRISGKAVRSAVVETVSHARNDSRNTASDKNGNRCGKANKHRPFHFIRFNLFA